MLRVARIDLAVHEAACQRVAPSKLPEIEAEIATLSEWRSALLREADGVEVMRRDALRARDAEAERLSAMQSATLRLQRTVLHAKEEMRSRHRAVHEPRRVTVPVVYVNVETCSPRRAS